VAEGTHQSEQRKLSGSRGGEGFRKIGRKGNVMIEFERWVQKKELQLSGTGKLTRSVLDHQLPGKVPRDLRGPNLTRGGNEVTGSGGGGKA